MFKLIDTFNNTRISQHRTLEAAVKADIKHGKAVRRNNGQNSYIPTKIVNTETGETVDHDQVLRLRSTLA